MTEYAESFENHSWIFRRTFTQNSKRFVEAMVLGRIKNQGGNFIADTFMGLEPLVTAHGTLEAARARVLATLNTTTL